jgi:hypothetical protein
MIVASSGENNSENYIVTILGEVLMAKKNRSTQLMSGIFLCQFLAKLPGELPGALWDVGCLGSHGMTRKSRTESSKQRS